MSFTKVASAKELPSGRMIGALIDNTKVLVANMDGTYYALGDVCTHRGCRLSGGMLKENGIVECPCHGSNFDVKTGRVTKGPATAPERVFQVKVEEDNVLVSIQ